MLKQSEFLETHYFRRPLMSPRRHLTILLTSAGRRVALLQAFRRGAEHLGVDLELLACDLEPMLSAACQVADRAFAVPPVTDPRYVEAVLTICRDRNVDLVIPTIDTELFALANAQAKFEAIGAEVSTSAVDVIEIARDKLMTARFFEANGIPTPRTATLAEVRDDPAGWTWPVIVKPRHGSASRSISVAENFSELPACESEPMIVQTLLRGDEWTVNIYIDREGRLRAVVPHRRIQVRAGEVEKGVTRRAPRLIELGERIAACLPGARGVLCYQAIVAQDGSASVFEINARFGGGYPLADYAGAAFARWLIEGRLGIASSAGNDWAEGITMLRYDAAVFVHS